MNKITLAVLTVIIAVLGYTSPVSAKECAIGYTKNSNGICVNVTTQRPVVSKASKKASAYAMCLTNTPNWTPAKQKACMRTKGYK